MLIFIMSGLGLFVLFYLLMLAVQLIQMERAIDTEMIKVEAKVSGYYKED